MHFRQHELASGPEGAGKGGMIKKGEGKEKERRIVNLGKEIE